MSVVWTPNPGSQVAFLTCPALEVLCEGTRGGGKSDALLMDFASGVGRGWGSAWRGMLFRRTFPQLADIVSKSKRWFHRTWGDSATWNGSTYTWRWQTGEELLLRYMRTPDDYWHYHGHELPWIGWEELTQWPDSACFEAMRSCSRSSTPNMPRKIRATANPYGVGHNWVREYFVDKAPASTVWYDGHGNSRARIPSSYRENAALLSADPEYESRLAADTNEMRRRAWQEGDWDIVAGGMFDDIWDRRVHVMEPFTVPEGWRIDRSHDWGSARPFATLWWAESNGEAVRMRNGTSRMFPRGTLVLIAEDYGWTGRPNTGCGASSQEIARRVRHVESMAGITGRVQPGPADSAIFTVTDGRSIASEMALAGCRWEASAKGKGSRVAGWQRIRDLLEAAAKVPQEEPGLFVFDVCTQWLRTVPTLPRDSREMDDVDTEAEDHAGDATRYRVSGADRRITEMEVHGI